MSLFRVQFQMGHDFVEAATMQEAITLWQRLIREDDPDSWSDEFPPIPDGVELMTTERVQR